MEEKNVSINGLNVAYIERKAENPRTTVVFIHGYPFAKELWSGQLSALPADVTGVAYDIRGFGRSEAGHRFFTIDLFARDFIEFVRALGLQQCIACGISMGGYIVLRAMEREPGLFGGAVLCDTTSLADTNDAKLARFNAIDAIMNEGTMKYSEAFVQQIFTESSLNTGTPAVRMIRDMIAATKPEVLCSTLLALASRTDTTAVLQQVNLPALVVRGDSDRIIGNDHLLALQMGIRNSRSATIAQAAHLPNLENAAEFNRRLNEFLNDFR